MVSCVRVCVYIEQLGKHVISKSGSSGENVTCKCMSPVKTVQCLLLNQVYVNLLDSQQTLRNLVRECQGRELLKVNQCQPTQVCVQFIVSPIEPGVRQPLTLSEDTGACASGKRAVIKTRSQARLLNAPPQKG